MSYELFCSGEVTSGMGLVWYCRVLIMWCFAVLSVVWRGDV